MFTAAYTISDKLLNSLVKLESDKTYLEAKDLPYSIRAKMTDKTKALNLFHLAHMINLSITIKDAEKMVEGRKLQLDDDRVDILNNFRNVLEFNRSTVADTYADIDLALLMHLNKIVLTNWKETWDVKFRGNHDAIDTALDNWVTVYDRTIQGMELQHSLTNLLEWYRTSSSQLHSVIRVSLLLFGIIELMPFASGNKLTILALADFLFTRLGYTHKMYLPIIRNFDLNNDEYVEAWSFARNAKEQSVWLERFIRNLSRDAHEAKVDAERIIGEEEEKNSKQPFLDLNKRQLKILRYLQNIPSVQREDYCQMMDVSTMTAYRDLNELLHKKLIRSDGKGRGTKYKLASR